MKNDPRQGPLQATDLRYSYSPAIEEWDDPRNRDAPTTTNIDRQDWYEILYFINSFSQRHPELGTEKDTALRIEQLLRSVVPIELNDKREVESWLIEHWNRYSSI